MVIGIKLKRNMNKVLIFLIILILSFIIVPLVNAKSAFLYLDPSKESFDVGEEFSVSVKVGTDFPINTVKTILHFPQDKLSILEISKEGSIFSLWAEEPKFSNESGEFSFIGGVPHPGFVGDDGQIISIKFKAEDRGTVKLDWGESAILANDGKGTNIFTYTKEGKYSLEVLAPMILSSTHPDEGKWYKDVNPKFRWELFPDIIDVSFILDKNPDSRPDNISEGRMNSKTYQGLDDGIWYFHLRTKDSSGWSSTRHFRVSIDTIPPNPFEIVVNNEGDPTNPRPILYFDVNDEISGIEYYVIEFETKDKVILANPGIKQHQLSLQGPGTHSVTVWAFDKAGNFRKNIAGVVIQPIEKPTITIWPRTYVAGEEKFYTEGMALPKTEVIIFLEKDNDITREWRAFTDDEGEWLFSTDDLLRSGIYYLFAKARDMRGATSEFSPKQEVEVTFSGIALGSFLVTSKNLVLVLAILLLVLILLAIYVAQRNLKIKKTLKKETEEAEQSLHRGFDELRKDIEREIGKLEGVKSERELDQKEKEITKNLKEDLKEVEKYIGKEIKDVEKELK